MVAMWVMPRLFKCKASCCIKYLYRIYTNIDAGHSHARCCRSRCLFWFLILVSCLTCKVPCSGELYCVTLYFRDYAMNIWNNERRQLSNTSDGARRAQSFHNVITNNYLMFYSAIQKIKTLFLYYLRYTSYHVIERTTWLSLFIVTMKLHEDAKSHSHEYGEYFDTHALTSLED